MYFFPVFSLSKSLPINLINNPIGVTNKMNIKKRIIGDTIIPNKIPNFDQTRFGILNIEGLTNEKNKKNNDMQKNIIEWKS